MSANSVTQSYERLWLDLRTCENNTLDPDCIDENTTQTIMANLLSKNDFIKWNFYMVDTQISSQNKDPIVKVINQDLFLPFGEKIGTRGKI